jgi:antitoxin HigA-1
MTTRSPSHPGKILKEVYMEEEGLSVNALAIALRVDPKRISAVVRGERSITVDTACRLGRFFGQNPQFWLNLQHTYDLKMFEREKKLDRINKEVLPLRRSA